MLQAQQLPSAAGVGAACGAADSQTVCVCQVRRPSSGRNKQLAS